MMRPNFIAAHRLERDGFVRDGFELGRIVVDVVVNGQKVNSFVLAQGLVVHLEAFLSGGIDLPELGQRSDGNSFSGLT